MPRTSQLDVRNSGNQKSTDAVNPMFGRGFGDEIIINLGFNAVKIALSIFIIIASQKMKRLENEGDMQIAYFGLVKRRNNLIADFQGPFAWPFQSSQ
jgi:hypothetical protein